MIHAQAGKYVLSTHPAAAVNSASWTVAEIDSLGYEYAEIVFAMGANDIGVTALKVQESDTSGGSFADVAGLIFGTSANIAGTTSALPLSTDDNKLWMFQIDLRGRKRFLNLVATNGNGTSGGFAAVITRLSRAGDIPSTAAEAGAKDILRV